MKLRQARKCYRSMMRGHGYRGTTWGRTFRRLHPMYFWRWFQLITPVVKEAQL